MNEETQPSSPVAVNDGADDVVEADVAASDAHHPHLVEGDFFPMEVPVVDADGGVGVGGGGGNEDEVNVDEIAARAAAVVAAASLASTPPRAAAAPSRKRVRWADGAGAAKAHRLVKHVTSFYMPYSSRGPRLDTNGPSSPTRPTHAAVVNPPPSVFRDKINTDGSTYKFCKAQRPALRFVEWKRHQHEYGTTPFEGQPAAAGDAGESGGPPEPLDAPAAPARTLFGVLFQRSVVTRVAEGQVRIRTASYHGRGANGFQMPFVRVGELYDEPLTIPLPP
ncbi:hypothetical protein ABB37_07467 [Leptomonas pyrrhocoris]|uniref:Uncharacterized protein n=1 Tax=Leptomonas pyrrhocoris TaxID=157538 RepID=A0A0N1J4H0_LEPPY|nr:hypothetical protein ABB37_07467 [Leptomonas pyrrhocoris]KPA76602.1 hypothetical protein ABB37_07467 [Leptomonas pyrrhocoris]|eukprot:XP_015655041.1 hypothetical protein ABB37_07467 [Leptomonas pyrrhocoris]